MKRLFGNTGGLKADQIRRLENLYRRQIPVDHLISFELCRDASLLSHEIHRQVCLLITRRGKIAFVVVGDHKGFIIPDLSEYRAATGRLKGLRCIHTHLTNEPLTRDDLTDLALLRLDMMAVITMTEEGRPHQVFAGHILPHNRDGKPYEMLAPLNPNQLNIGCLELIQAIETELSLARTTNDADSEQERALLVSVTSETRNRAKISIAELKELTTSSGIQVVGMEIQQRKQIDSRFLIGTGKLEELTIKALQLGATLIIFDQELNPSQIRSITDQIETKVIDRTQLILDIFAQRARTREGKLQVELAQLKYLLPRLISKNTAMSRLTGGIGGRGPGETKLEINRRRVRERISRLDKAVSQVIRQRNQQKAKRHKRGLPVLSIIGYTNAGKSTLLNTLTKSRVLAEKRLFATLDPTSRRLKFPKETEVIITDTVGFIKDLPKELMAAFRATLEELTSADLFLHVIDISNPRFNEQIESVERILTDLDLDRTPLIRILNKKDLVDNDVIEREIRLLAGVAISANAEASLFPLVEKMEAAVLRISGSGARANTP